MSLRHGPPGPVCVLAAIFNKVLLQPLLAPGATETETFRSRTKELRTHDRRAARSTRAIPNAGSDHCALTTIPFFPAPRLRLCYSPCPHPAADWTAGGLSLQICSCWLLAASCGTGRQRQHSCGVAARNCGELPPSRRPDTPSPPAGRQRRRCWGAAVRYGDEPPL